jgi:Rieske Fe-S protein
MLVRDSILGRTNPWAELYDPARKPLRAALTFIKEQANVARQYADWVGAGDELTPAALLAGEGALLRHGMKLLAVYRDAQGGLHCRSASCPHLGCVVQWNGVEKTWDCPCHGSRFSAYGTVLHGPASTDLAAVDEAIQQAVLEAARDQDPQQPSDSARRI